MSQVNERQFIQIQKKLFPEFLQLTHIPQDSKVYIH